MKCVRCNDTGTVITAGPDENGMYDADDCPDCSQGSPCPYCGYIPVDVSHACSRFDELKDLGYCPHGVYVGGVGIDWMCGRCEDGT